MTPYDVLIKNKFNSTIILENLSIIFSISKDDILIIYDINELEKKVEKRLICLVQYLEGDFHTFLTFFSKLELIDKGMELQLADHLCKEFHNEVMFPSDSENPYEMNVISENGSKKKVFVNSMELDEFERYVIEK